MGKVEKTKKIYRLKNISVDSIVEYHLYCLNLGLFNVREFIMPQCTFGNEITTIKAKNEDTSVVKKKNLLHDKYIYLIHTIINRMFENGGDMVSLNSKVLQDVFGKDYNNMIRVLIKMNIVYSSNYYVIGEKSYAYGIYSNVPITYTLEYSNYLSKYADKMKKHLDAYKSKLELTNREILGDNELYTRYNKSLKQLKMLYIEEAREFVAHHYFASMFSKYYYEYIIDRYIKGDFTITQVDKNRRIYNIATSTPRILKPFLNIKFTVDVHNSHPLLFNKILYTYYGISSSLVERLNNIFSSLYIPSHNVSRLIRNKLINNGLEKEEIKNIQTDILAYLYLTSTGHFWESVISEELISKHKLLRNDIKVLMFAEVFYSKKLNTKGQFYGKLFRDKFPHVYSVIRKQKFSDRTKLANDMMRMESELFREVLMRLNTKYDVISIHDAIVILDTPKNKDCTGEIVSMEIHNIYKKHGLHPDVAVDYYGYACMLDALSKEADMNEKIQAYLKRLKDMVDNGEEDNKILLEEINNGIYDFCYNADHSDVVLHPVNMKVFTKSQNSGK